MKNLKLNKKGFTLIELMIVIAIIGVLAAIAIPNYINYRNTAYCSAVESNVHNLGAAISEYYSIPSRTATLPVITTDLGWSAQTVADYTLVLTSGTNTAGNATIIITAKDNGSRCPLKYQNAATNNGWDGAWNYQLTM